MMAGESVGLGRPIIVTKVRPPRRRRDLLRRERLIRYLSDHVDRKLVLISAPAGYGKTSVLVDYVQESTFPLCWYRVDESDSDPVVFLEYFIASLRQRYPGVGERTLTLLRTQTPVDVESVSGSLVNEIDEQIGEFFLFVLDDFQKLDAATLVNAAVDTLLLYLPDNCQVVVASRTLPKKLTLTRLAAQGQVVGIGLDQLRFTLDEIHDLVLLQQGRDLSEMECAELDERSEGWAAVLTMATGSLSTLKPAKRDPLGADQGQLYDFLAQEVLARQAEDVCEFLLGTAILDSLTPALCDAVLDRTDSAAMLRRLDEHNLFLVPIEGEGDWYRYHQLFHEFLESPVAASGRPDTADRHRRAAVWYAQAGQSELEIQHLLRAGDYDAAAVRIEAEIDAAFEHGQLHVIIGWVAALPIEIQCARPRLLYHQAGAYSFVGNLAEALEVYRRAIDLTTDAGNDEVLAEALSGRAMALRFMGQTDESITDARRAILLAGDITSQAAADAHRNLGACYALRGDMATAAQELAAALDSFERMGLVSQAASTHADLSAMLQMTGRIEQSIVHAEAARPLWDEIGNTAGLARVLNNLATAYHAQGRFREARRWLDDSVAKARLAGIRRVEALALVGLGDVESDLDHFDAAIGHYQAGIEMARSVGEGTLVCYALAACAEAMRLGGRQTDAGQTLALAGEELTVYRSAFEAALVDYARGTLAFERGQHEPAIEQLEDAARGFEAMGSKREQARALLYRCAVAHRTGAEQDAKYWWGIARDVMEEFGYPDSFGPYARRLPEVFAREYIREIDDDSPILLPRTTAIDVPVLRDDRPATAAEADAEPRVAVLAFGPPEVFVNGEPLGLSHWKTQPARDLFLYLLDRPKGATRDELMNAFWPDSSHVRARSSLHSTTHRVRRAVGKSGVVCDGDHYFVGVPTDRVYYDVGLFEEHLDRTRKEADDSVAITEFEAAVSLIRGEYLEGVGAEWCHSRRETLSLEVTDALLGFAEANVKVGRFAQAIAEYRRALGRDELREDIHRGLMRAYVANGDRALAVRQYERLEHVLAKELEVSPDPETVALLHAIRERHELPAA